MIKFLKSIKLFHNKMKEDHVGAFAASAAYFIMLSFIPFIMLLFSLIQYTPVTKSDIYTLATTILPSTLDPMVISIVDEVYSKSIAIVSITAITAAWTAGKGALSIMRGLNNIYKVKETRNYVILRARSAFYVLIFVLSIVLSLLFLVFGNKIHTFIVKNMPLLGKISEVLIHIRTLVLFCLLIFFFLIIYTYIPNRKTSIKSQFPGALFTATAWSIFSFGFSIYVDKFGGFSYMYASLTNIILVMLWLYFCMYLMLIGAEVNCYYENRYKQIV